MAVIQEKIRHEWKASHHNASLLGKWPEFEDEREGEQFWEWMGGERAWALENLAGIVEERWGVRLEFAGAGRNGATILPYQYVHEGAWAGRTLEAGRLIAYIQEERNDYSNLGEYNATRTALAILRYNNQYWYDSVNALASHWETIREEWRSE